MEKQMEQGRANEVDFYISRFSPPVQQRLIAIRAIALKTFQGATERLCHSLPAFAHDGRVFMFYGAYKKHVSICVGYDWIDFLKLQYPQFSYTKATIIFPHDAPLPEDVVQVICDLVNQGRQNVTGM